MARLGNEARLVISLTLQRLASLKDDLDQRKGVSVDYREGYANAINDYESITEGIEEQLQK